jgi:hypothetical protein
VYFSIKRSNAGYVVYGTPLLRLGTTDLDGSQQQTNSDAAYHTYNQVITRPGGGSWSWTDVDALEAGIDFNSGFSVHVGYCDWLYVVVDYTPPSVTISNSPSSVAFGGTTPVQPGGTYYAYNQSTGSYPNPVTSSQCYFTITNSGSDFVNLALSCTNATGGNTWTLVGSTPTGDQFEVVAVYNTEDPSSGLVLTTSPVSFYTGLAASGTLQWDFKEILGGMGSGKSGTFSDSSSKTYTITITGS